jgi:hypothetical protein
MTDLCVEQDALPTTLNPALLVPHVALPVNHA